MKRYIYQFSTVLIIILTNLFISMSSFAQPPEKMSFQAVIRNSSGKLVQSTLIGMKISVLQGSASGTAAYIETQTATTNINGLVTIEIGGGTVVTGAFNLVDWANGPYYVKTETDLNGGTNYTISGTSQLLSVPYALHSKTVYSFDYNSLTNKPTLFSGDYADLTNKPTLFSGSYTDLTNKPTLFSGSYTDLTNKPTLFDGKWTSLTGKPTFATVATTGSYTDLINIPAVPSNVIPRIAMKGQKLSVTFSGGDNLTFSQSSSSCPKLYADVVLTILSGTPTIIYPVDEYYIDSKRFDAVFDIPSYVPSGLYNIILAPTTSCPYGLSNSFKIH